MPRRGRALFALLSLATLTAVAIIAVVALRLRGVERSAGGGRGTPVTSVAPADVIRLVVDLGGARVALERRGPAAWRVVAPRDAPADPAAVEAVLGNVSALRRRATLAAPGGDPSALRPYGLDAPRARLVLGLRGGGDAALALGAGMGADGVAFVEAPGGEVVVIAADAATRLEASLTALARAAAADDPSPGRPAAAAARDR
jgi:hypothetical protein